MSKEGVRQTVVRNSFSTVSAPIRSREEMAVRWKENPGNYNLNFRLALAARKKEIAKS